MALDKDSQWKSVTLRWQEVTVWSRENIAWYRRRGATQRNFILQNVQGAISDGEFVGVIGPSGAGKTTFLASLAGKVRLPHEGSVAVNGTPVDCLQRGFLELVPQYDVFMDKLTVLEHLLFMAEMKLSNHTSAATKWSKLQAVVARLKLSAHVGSAVATLSGGERKLLSLATSLLSDPRIILCDEPTTGLDAHSAGLVVSVLEDLARSGAVVVCSIHQPSSIIFHQFHSIILLAEAKLLFQGTQDECKELFASVNLVCPKSYNPAEFYISKVSRRDDDDTRRRNNVHKLHETYTNQQQTSFVDVGQNAVSLSRVYRISRPNWLRQVFLLMWRSSLSLKRDIPTHLFQLFLHLVSALILCVVYYGVTGSDEQRDVQNMRGLLWLITSEVSFGLTYASLGAFDFDLSLFKRESDVYSSSAYYVATFICVLPRCVIWPFLYLLISTCGIGFPSYEDIIWQLTITLTLLAVTSSAYGVGMAALFTTTGVIVDIMPCVDLLLFLASGAFVRLSSFPAWSRPLRYISHFYYGLEAVSNIYWQKVDSLECNQNATWSCVRDGAQVLAEDDYATDFILQDSFGLTALALAWCLVGYWGLRREGKKGYAY